MALATNFVNKQAIDIVWSNTNNPLGTIHEVGDTWLRPKVVEFGLPSKTTALEVGPAINNTGVQFEDNAIHRKDTAVWTFDMTVIAEDSVLSSIMLGIMGDGATPYALTGALGLDGAGNYSIEHGTSSTIPYTVLFQNAGEDATNVDMSCVGCFLQSVTLRQDAGANAGQMVAELSFWTPYAPNQVAHTPSSITDGGDESANIFNITASPTLDAQDLHVNAWELTFSKTFARIGYQDTTNYLPYGACQTGVTEVTGSLTVKRDDGTYNFADHEYGDSTGIALSMAWTNPTFSISASDVMIDNSTIDSGGDYLTTTIPFRCFAENSSRTATVVSLTSA